MTFNNNISVMIVIAIMLFIINCSSEANQLTNKIDRINQLVNEIDINKNKFTIDSTEIMDKSTEGGIILSFKAGKNLVEIECHFYGESGQSSEMYYFSDMKLIFYKYSFIKYKGLVYSANFEIENEYNVSYYIENNQIIQKKYSDEVIADKYEYKSKSYSQIQNDVDNYMDIIKEKN